MSQLRQAGCIRASELTSQCVCSEMHQCTLRLISMYGLALCVEKLCVGECSTSLKLVDWPGASCRKFRCKMPTATFATCSLITYFRESRKQHCFTQSKPSWGNNNVEENITHKIILSLSWRNFTRQSTSKIEPPIGTRSRKQNFPCDDQVRINNIVIESKTSGLNLKKEIASQILRYNPLRYHKSARHVLKNKIHWGWIEIPVTF